MRKLRVFCIAALINRNRMALAIFLACLLGTINTAVYAAEEEKPKATEKEGESAVRPMVVSLNEQLHQVEMPSRDLMDVARLGEKLEYFIKWKGLPAGEAIFTVKPFPTRVSRRQAYYLVLETESNDFISKFYKVRDKIKSYVDAETGHSLYFIRNIREGSYQADEYLEFDYENNVQHFSAIKKSGERKTQKKKDPIAIPGPLQDPLSVLYYLRHFKIEEGGVVQTLVGSRKRTDILEIRTVRTETISLAELGRYEANVVELAGGGNKKGYQPKIFVAKGKILVWVEKNTNIPLMVQVEVPILGNADVILHRTTNCDLEKYAIKGE